MGTERVVKLLRSHRIRIARALVRQSRALAPRYEQIDTIALERSYLGLLFAIDRVLEHGDDALLAEQTEQLATMRSATGFQMEDFLLATLGFLPVIRQFLLEHGANQSEAIEDYETFEAIALPLVARAASTFLEAAEEPTIPNARRRPMQTKRLRSLPVERVTGSDDDENDPTFRNFSTPFSSNLS